MKKKVLVAPMLALMLCSIALVSCSPKEDGNKIPDGAEFLVTETAEGAEVFTANGTAYQATGYKAYENGLFTINQDFSAELSALSSQEEVFTRVCVSYESDSPLKMQATYTQDGEEVLDLLYLEAGKSQFNFLVKDFIKGKEASALKSLRISTCQGGDAKFMLLGCHTEKVAKPEGASYYLQNERYRLGVRLSWGGGISLLQDKNAKEINDVKNLVNQADEGRLVQQSYYGTAGNDEYTPGEFNGSKWTYNPVQGGDKNRNQSRLIDFQVEDHYVYVKAQPQDWSLNKQITPSYMENRYELGEDVIRVDNRFVDFSGWTHQHASQELPAFYTISWLDNFYYYGGCEPWTDDALTAEPSLNFWGDPAYHNDCLFSMQESNTETWCAWINDEANYGIGLYVPNVDQFLAGKFSYNGSKSSLDAATNYVAPLNSLMIVSYEPIEYSYLITTGSLEHIRSVFKENKDFADNASLHKNYISGRVPDAVADMTSIDFSDPENAALLLPRNSTSAAYSQEQQALKLEVLDGDVQTELIYSSSKKEMTAEVYKNISITYMIPTTNAYDTYSYEMFLCAGSTTFAVSDKSVRGEWIKDGEYHTLTIPLEGLDFWQGKINSIRFDYFNVANPADVFYVKSITFS